MQLMYAQLLVRPRLRVVKDFLGKKKGPLDFNAVTKTADITSASWDWVWSDQDMQKSFSSSILKLAGLSAVRAKSGSSHYSGFRLAQLPKPSDVITANIIKSLEDAGYNVQLIYAVRLHQQRVTPTDPMYQGYQSLAMGQINAPEAWGIGQQARQVGG